VPYRLPTQHEREALFSWLKQASSLTAWERVLAHHQAFVDVVEKAFQDTHRHPPEGEDPYIPEGWMSDLLSSHVAFRAAVARLHKGDRSCFRFLGASGHFNQGISGIKFWRTLHDRYFHMGESDFPPVRSPSWPAIEQAMKACLNVYLQAAVVLQPQHLDVPAPVRSADSLQKHPDHFPFKILLRQPALPPVPSVEPPVLVKTGRTISTYGIWEPVTKVGSRYETDGCLNYLHADSPAPTIDFPEDGQRHEGRPTLWRLIWADERYGEQPVPREESSYIVAIPRVTTDPP